MQRNRGKAGLDAALSYSWMRPGSPVCVRARVCLYLCVSVCCSSAMAFHSFKDFASLQDTPSPQFPSAQRSPSHGLTGHSIWGSGPHQGERGLQQTIENLAGRRGEAQGRSSQSLG